MADRMEELRRRHDAALSRLARPGRGVTPQPPPGETGNPAAPASTPSKATLPPAVAPPGRQWPWGAMGLLGAAAAVVAMIVVLARAPSSGTAPSTNRAETLTPGAPPAAAAEPGSPTSETPPPNPPPADEETSDEDGVGMGTGWVCHSGLVVTNHHVIAGGREFAVVFGRDRAVPATLITSDAANDVALLRLQGPVPAGLPLASGPVALGQRVFTIGFPHADLLGIEPKVTDGTISSVNGMQDDPRTLQISVPVQPGNSGGPLLNLRGEVVGVVTSKLNAIEVFRYTGDIPQNVNFAIKADYVRSLLQSAGQDRSGAVVAPADGDLEDAVRRVRESVVIVLSKR